MNLKCEKCGADLEPNAKFCISCGKEISEENKNKIENKKPTSKVKIWIFKFIAIIIAAFIFTMARVFFTLINGGTIDSKIEVGGILLFYGVYALISGLFLKDKDARKRGAWILAIYIVGSIAFSYYINNSSFGIDEKLRNMSRRTPITIDQDTILSKVLINGNDITFKYILINVSRNDISYSNLQNFKQTMKNEFCKDKGFLKMMKYNKNINLYYFGKNNELISNIKISNRECQ